jgi:hypothetical protein
MVIELIDDEGNVAELDDPAGPKPARIEQEITIAPVPGAPNGIPGQGAFLIDLPIGTIRILAPRRRYSWRVQVGGDVGGTGFWVNAHPAGPIVGRPPA